MKRVNLFTLLLMFPVFCLKAQLPENIRAVAEIQGIGTSNGVVPFWMRSNNYGSLPESGISTGLIGSIIKDYDRSPRGIYDRREKAVSWAFGLEARANIGKKQSVKFIEAYAKLKLSVFEIKVGRTKDVMGLNGDTSLSSGNFAVSGNSLGIPKIDISIPEYFSLPIFDNIFSFKGNFVHGWVGRINILKLVPNENGQLKYNVDDFKASTYYHQKSFYGRLGNQDWRLKVYGGFSHQVYWDDQKSAYGNDVTISKLQTFFYVATGKVYGAQNIPTSKIGNQLGSIDLGMEYSFDRVKILGYRQNFYDVGALSKLANIRDGLNGITIENLDYQTSNKEVNWKKLLFEYFYSKDQAGYPWSIPTASGDEDYYNNYYFRQGWSYRGLGLGNPLVTATTDAKSGQVHDPFDYFINNRVVAAHLGGEGSVNDWDIKFKASYSFNYGTFATSPYGKSTGGSNTTPIGLFEKVQQFSLILESGKFLNETLYLGISTALDQGKLLNNSFGCILKLRKTFY